MSLLTWRKEFYPVLAEECRGNAIQHSLRKWRGLLKENLRKHSVKLMSDWPCLEDRSVESCESFYVDSKSCALCFRYLSYTCRNCPLRKFLGYRCDDSPDDIDDQGCSGLAPYRSFSLKRDPKPMIWALEKTQEFVRLPANRKRWPKEVKK